MSIGPAKSERLTHEDVRAVLSKSSQLEDPQIVGFEIKPFSNEPLGYLGVHELLRVEARERADGAAAKKQLSFFVKSKGSADTDFDRLIFREESKFFGDVMPELLADFRSEAWAAECYLVKDDRFLVLEDLRDRGYAAANRALELHELKSAIGCLARFHATSMLLEGRAARTLDEAYPGFFREKTFLKDGGFSWRWLSSGMEVVEVVAEGLGLDANMVSKAYDMAVEMVLPAKDRRNVLCHLDLWCNNFMFDDSRTSCRLVDFQMLAYTCYAVDLAEIVYLNTRVGARQRCERELLEVYHSVLDENLRLHDYKGKCISLEEVVRDFEERRICGLVVAVQFLPIILWGKEMARKYSDPDECLYYMYTSRIELVRKAMQQDDNYRCRIEEIVRELLDYMEMFKYK